MTTITLSKELTKDEKLIAVPYKIYEEFLIWQKKQKMTRTFKPTIAEKKALERGRKNFTQGEYITLKELSYELGVNH